MMTIIILYVHMMIIIIPKWEDNLRVNMKDRVGGGGGGAKTDVT